MQQRMVETTFTICTGIFRFNNVHCAVDAVALFALVFVDAHDRHNSLDFLQVSTTASETFTSNEPISHYVHYHCGSFNSVAGGTVHGSGVCVCALVFPGSSIVCVCV